MDKNHRINIEIQVHDNGFWAELSATSKGLIYTAISVISSFLLGIIVFIWKKYGRDIAESISSRFSQIFGDATPFSRLENCSNHSGEEDSSSSDA